MCDCRDPVLLDNGSNRKLGQHQSISSKPQVGDGSPSPPPDSGPLSSGKSFCSEATTVPDVVAASSSVDAQEEEVVDDDDGDYEHGNEDGGGEFTDETFALCDETEIEHSPIVARSGSRGKRISGSGGKTACVTGSGDGKEEKAENSGNVLGKGSTKRGKTGAVLQRGAYRLNRRSILSPSTYLFRSSKGRQSRGGMETTPEGKVGWKGRGSCAFLFLFYFVLGLKWDPFSGGGLTFAAVSAVRLYEASLLLRHFMCRTQITRENYGCIGVKASKNVIYLFHYDI